MNGRFDERFAHLSTPSHPSAPAMTEDWKKEFWRCLEAGARAMTDDRKEALMTRRLSSYEQCLKGAKEQVLG